MASSSSRAYPYLRTAASFTDRMARVWASYTNTGCGMARNSCRYRSSLFRSASWAVFSAEMSSATVTTPRAPAGSLSIPSGIHSGALLVSHGRASPFGVG